MSDHHSEFHAVGRVDEASAASWERPSTIAKESLEPIEWSRLIDWLPRMGSVLWIYRAQGDLMFPRARILSRGALLLDHPALAAFAHCAGVEAQGHIGAQGPREWLALCDARGDCLARMHLLPDTDYMAWDDMVATCAIPHSTGLVTSRTTSRGFLDGAKHAVWYARVARFPALRLPCLQLLGLRPPHDLSKLGLDVAMQIARDELAIMQAV